MGLKFLFPINGDVIHSRDGEVVDGAVLCAVKVEGTVGKKVTINGVSATENQGVYSAVVPLKGFPTEVIAECECGVKESISVFAAPGYADKYRVSIDDVIWLFRDIHENNYQSIFEHPFLAFFRELNREYGTKLHLNLYFEDNDMGAKAGSVAFRLSEFSEKYRDEWKANADWIRLSFHGLANYPLWPYKDADYETVYQDAMAVRKEIERFAGEELLGRTTTLHFGEATMDGVRALRDAGWNILPEDFNVDEEGLPPASFYLSVEERRHMKRRFVWYDDRTEVFLFRCAIILDTFKLEDISSRLDEINADPAKGAYMDLLIHEQYFHKKYPRYQADYCDKVRAAVEWAVKNGYQPAFLDEALSG